MENEMQENSTDFGLINFVRKSIEDIGWKQTDLARLSGVGDSVVSRLLSEKKPCKNIGIDNLNKILKTIIEKGGKDGDPGPDLLQTGIKHKGGQPLDSDEKHYLLYELRRKNDEIDKLNKKVEELEAEVKNLSKKEVPHSESSPEGRTLQH